LGALQFWLVATLMVVATTATLVVPMFWRLRGADAANGVVISAARLRWLAFAAAAAVPLIALALYAGFGRPDLLAHQTPPPDVSSVAALHARAEMRGGSGDNGGDLDAATQKLRARLEANPDDAGGWRLLAQSYEFQGRAAEAAEANQRAAMAESGAPMPATPVAAVALDQTSDKLAQTAQEHRRRREFTQAVTAFAALAKRGPMSADLWADYADAIGGAHGTLDADAAACIDSALRIDPDHPKALWLRASRQTQQQDFTAALVTWQHLARILPPDSPDAKIIAANLEEARGKLAAGSATAMNAVAASPMIGLHGSVRLDPRLTARVGSGAVLFVFARAADERGPPLAVWRTNPGPWPLKFVLDDRNAMMPGRKLSDFKRVILEARISHSGNALAQPGDLRAVSAVLDPHGAAEQQLVIAEVVGTTTNAQGG